MQKLSVSSVITNPLPNQMINTSGGVTRSRSMNSDFLSWFVRLEGPFPQGMGQLVAGEASSCLTEKLTVRETQGVPFAIKDL